VLCNILGTGLLEALEGYLVFKSGDQLDIGEFILVIRLVCVFEYPQEK
jgi:hypothetical protein